MSVKINIGCGQTPVEGWLNFDNSPSIRLAKSSLLSGLLSSMRLISAQQAKFVKFARDRDIQWADATRKIPQPDNTVEVVYSSHMLEHLPRERVDSFLSEVKRVLRPGGTLRLAVPDLRFHVNNYLSSADADEFISAIQLSKQRPPGFTGKIRYLLFGERHHQWMYDGPSLSKLLASKGFEDVQILEAGQTTLMDPGELNLSERHPESVFVEARYG